MKGFGSYGGMETINWGMGAIFLKNKKIKDNIFEIMKEKSGIWLAFL